MKKILVVGEVYSTNLGDGIICEVVNGIVEDNYITSYLDLSGRKKFEETVVTSTSFSYWRSEFNFIKSRIKSFLFSIGYKKSGNNLLYIIQKFHSEFDKKISEFSPDAILFAGGQMFIESFVNQIMYVCEYASEHKIPVIFNACGIGKLDNQSLQKVEKILSMDCVQLISVRDGVEEFQKLTRKKVNDTFDTAVMSSEHYQLGDDSEKKKDVIGVGIMLSTLQPVRKQISFWDEMLSILKSQNVEFKIFTNGSVQDYLFAKFLLQRNSLDLCLLIDTPNYPDELVKIISSFKTILSMRLHSLIVAYSYDIPSVAISWDDKVKTFYEKIDASEACFDIFESPHTILNHLFQNLEYKYNLDKKEIIVSSVKENFNLIKEVLR